MLPAQLESEFDLWRDERTPTWLVLVPLLLVIITLVALVVVPHLITARNAALRQELTEVLMPLTVLHTDLERSLAAEAASARGYALTGDPFFSDRFLTVHAYAERVAEDVDSIAAQVGGEVAQAAEAFRNERSAWDESNFGLTPSEFRASLPEHQRQYEAVTAAAQRFEEVLGREVDRHRQEIEEAYRLRSLITVALAVVALFAGGAALWLAYRLRRNSRALLRRARDEAALRRIAQAMAEAEDLPGALGLVVGALAETAYADAAHIEQVDARREAVEVIAAIGERAPALGARRPYQGSSAEKVIARDSAVRAELGAVAQEGLYAFGDGDTAGSDHLLVVPLLAEGEALGAIVLLRSLSKQPFNAVEAKRTRLLADMAALVLQRLGDFDEVRQKEQALQETTAELRDLTETLEKRVQDRTRRVHELARELTLAEQRERREIAQVLHDDLQQALFGLQLSLQMLAERAPALDAATLRTELHRTHELVGETIASTRRLTVDLSPPILPGEGLAEALDWLAEHMRERFGLTVNIRNLGTVSVLADDLRSLLFQVVREFLFNVVKHADTDCATVTLYEDGGFYAIEVADEGVGVDPEASSAEGTSTLGGFGLRRARERLRLFGGRSDVVPKPGGGTRATVALPMELVKNGGEV